MKRGKWNLSEQTKEPIPEWDISLMHTHFRKDHDEAVKYFGKKVVEAESPHRSEIGKNPSICRKLYGLGHILNETTLFHFNALDNHVWLPQPNLKSDKLMHICFNCGSLKIDGRFIPYTDLKK